MAERRKLTRAKPANPELTELATRLARAIAAAETAPPESQPRALLFRVGPQRLALPLTAVREVVLPPDQLSRVPRAPAALLGIMNLRGRVVAVVDLAHTLPEVMAGSVLEGRSSGSPGDSLRDGRVLIMERGGHEVIGLLVRVVDGISPLPASNLAGPVLLDPDKVAAAIDALVA